MPPPQDSLAIEDDERQFKNAPLAKEELEQKYPNRPRNHSKTLPFHHLFLNLFNPLNENQKRPTGPTVARAKVGPHGPSKPSPHENRRNIIERFISRWRTEVGDDFYPALRLILPEKDRDRPMYGLKEKAIARLIIKLLNLHQDSDDGFNLLNFKLPARGPSSQKAGDFAGRCYEVISKRPMLQEPGNMRIAEVNELLDKLAGASKEDSQLPVFKTFYERMNADEMMWLIRIILRAMKVGATEKTFLNLWHADGEALFNVSSSLRRVCWELSDPSIRLEGDEAGVSITSCYQPQLAQFQIHSFQKMVDMMRPAEEDAEFWIEEKLDGERMQMHMIEDSEAKGGYRFSWWSRKGKDYTYLYGNSFEDDNSALTRHIKTAFDPRIRSLVLDGEMITWDPVRDKMVGFGSLKTAAIAEQRNPYQDSGERPLYRVFDCLYVNGEDITRYTLRDRRNVLEKSVSDVHRRIEKHQYEIAHDVSDIEPALRKVVAEASEGLVLKKPASMYRLNSRNDDWIKVKPEYTTEFGESLDCVIIGGYYGEGHRGGKVASFLCGLRVDKDDIDAGAKSEKCYSFFKVGGGFRAEDYAQVQKEIGEKWHKWDKKLPPIEYIKLGGGDRQFERPDLWIKPSESIVIEVKAASVGASSQYGVDYTLRFPRFKKLRLDKGWQEALSVHEFIQQKIKFESESKEKDFKVDTKRKMAKKLKKDVVIAGNTEKVQAPYAGPTTQIFQGLHFCVLSEMTQPQKKSKAEIEQMIKSNGGDIFQSPNAKEDMIIIGEKRVVKVASLIKAGQTNIIKPAWMLDALRQAETDGSERPKFLIPFEPSHMFHVTPDSNEEIEGNIDDYGDSYARDVTADDMKRVLASMEYVPDPGFSPEQFKQQLEEHGRGLGEMRGSIFRSCKASFISDEGADESKTALDAELAKMHLRFAGGHTMDEDSVDSTHIVFMNEKSGKIDQIRKRLAASNRSKLPRIVGVSWIEDCWRGRTLLDEERYVV